MSQGDKTDIPRYFVLCSLGNEYRPINVSTLTLTDECECLYLSVWGAGEAAVVSGVTGGVLQTEAGLVALSYLPLSLDVQQLVQTELVHAVEVTEQQQQVYKSVHLTKTLIWVLNCYW